MNDCLLFARRGLMLALVAGVLGAGGAATAREPPHWATGSALQKRLNSPLTILLLGNSLRQAVGKLSRLQGVAVLIDRRVDPDEKLDIRWDGVPLRAGLEEIAQTRGLGVSLLGPVLYLGPRGAAAQLRTLSALREEDVRRLPKAAAEKFTRAKAMAWDDLATPRELIEKLAAQNGLEVAGLDLVPHDLWAAADLPPLSWTDRLTLIALQFDLTFAISADGTEVRLVRVPDRVAIVRSYPGGADAEETVAEVCRPGPGSGSEALGRPGLCPRPGRGPGADYATPPSGAAAEAARPPVPGLRAVHARREPAAGGGAAGATRPALEIGTGDRSAGDRSGGHIPGAAGFFPRGQGDG